MNSLVLIPSRNKLRYTFFGEDDRRPLLRSTGRGDPAEFQALLATLKLVDADCRAMAQGGPDVIAIRLPYGGELFDGPALATENSLAQLQSLVPEAPLDLPVDLVCIDACRRFYPHLPILLVFETSFFVNLPVRERSYGLGGEHGRLRRFGYHGLYHEAACAYARKLPPGREDRGRCRMLSLCLEPQVEVAAAIGARAVMVTSGATPLEGLPGQTSCGELDPSIVLTLGEKLSWGPEQINRVLTQESGLVGLVGRPITLGELFTSTSPELPLAREVMEYRMLLACGSGMAAMGGADAMVFCGRYGAAGEIVGPRLAERLSAAAPGDQQIVWACFRGPIDRIVADAAMAGALQAA